MKKQNIVQIFIMILLASLCSPNFNNAWAIENKSRVISSYWQSDSASYSFISVSHSSLSGLASQIGLVINAIQSDLTAFGTAVTFTISAGSTQRIFIARTNHPSLSPAEIPTASFIIGTSNYKHGHIRVDPVASNPEISINPAIASVLDSNLELRGNVGETFSGLPYEKGLELVSQLGEMIPNDIPLSLAALRWILDFEAVSVLIPGSKSPEQVQRNCQASDLTSLAPSLHETLNQFYKQDIASFIRGKY